MVQLSICLPTRNRQSYCIETIKALAASESRGFEVIVADNSDDPGPLDAFLNKQLKDGRFRLIPLPRLCCRW
ncbi:glycosyltransferase [Hoeflea alexandrii]|uniref:glycosyltransferase family 2 protein n=1 Tax=Hoeflea alexandrii TaxID=288436 RepID=UPI00226E0397|nr:glycosyltransferase [Hoeflea alexandrii]MCY0152682.1 glycosyltransferase [Hoeflea alexandrii]